VGTLAETVVVIWVHAIFKGNPPFSSRTVPAINRHFWSGFPIATFDYRRVVGESMNYGHQHVSCLCILKNMLIIQYTIPWMLILPREDNYMCQNQKELVGIVSNVQYVYIYIYTYVFIYTYMLLSIGIYTIDIYLFIYIYIYDWYLYIYTFAGQQPRLGIVWNVLLFDWKFKCKQLNKWGTSLQENQRTRITLKVPMKSRSLWSGVPTGVVGSTGQDK
jgi:hypothetical protein